MTHNKQIRAVLLAALMVFSVFAGSIAFTGSAAADVASDSIDLGNGAGNAVSVEAGSSASISTVKVNDTNASTGTLIAWVDVDDDGVLDEGEPNASTTSTGANDGQNLGSFDLSSLDAGTYNVSATEDTDGSVDYNETANTTVEDQLTVTAAEKPSFLSAIHYQNGSAAADGEVEVAFSENVTVNSINVTDGTADDSYTSADDVSNGRVLFNVGEVYTDDLEVTYTVTDDAGNEMTGTEDVTFAPVFVNGSPTNNTAYKGSKVAVVADGTNTDVEVSGVDEDNSYQFSGSTGTASQVFIFDTTGKTLDTYEFAIDGESTASVDVRDLGLEVAVDETNVTTDDALEGTVSANAGGRSIEVVALDSDGDEVDGATDSFDLDGQGEADYNLGTVDAGEYTVEVTDTFSGVTIESDTITVEKAADSSSDFSESVITEQTGDIAEITVTLQGTDEAEVMIGGDNVGYTANVTVEDGNDDGEVTLLFNTYDAANPASFDVDDSDDDLSVTSDNITTSVSDVLDAGDYDLEVATGGDADNVGTLVLEERSTDSQAVWTAPTGDASDLAEAEDVYDAIENENLTQTDSVANGDVVVHQVVATGLEGAFDAKNFSELSGDEFNLTVEQTNPGPNREAKVLGINSSSATVIADGDNDTYFVVYDLDDVSASRTEFYNSSADQYDVEDDDAFNATFTVLEDGTLTDVEDGEEVSAEYDVVAPELSLDEDPINVSASAEQTVSGSASVAPGTALTIRVKSTGDTQPRFLKTGSAYVQADGSYSAAFDFSEQKSGDEFEVTVSVDSGSASDVTADGNVGDVQTETTTEETTTEETTTEETTTETTTEETTTETTTEETEEPAETTTESSTPGFGIAVALVALVAAALLAVRRD